MKHYPWYNLLCLKKITGLYFWLWKNYLALFFYDLASTDKFNLATLLSSSRSVFCRHGDESYSNINKWNGGGSRFPTSTNKELNHPYKNRKTAETESHWIYGKLDLFCFRQIFALAGIISKYPFWHAMNFSIKVRCLL